MMTVSIGYDPGHVGALKPNLLAEADQELR
jgi:hypothetical protein